MNNDLQNLKEIMAKANPSLTDVETATMKGLEDVCASFLKSRVIRQNLVIPSVMKAAQAFSGMPEGVWSDSAFVKKVTLKNLGNITGALIKAWPQLQKEDVFESVMQGCKNWVNKVNAENA